MKIKFIESNEEKPKMGGFSYILTTIILILLRELLSTHVVGNVININFAHNFNLPLTALKTA